MVSDLSQSNKKSGNTIAALQLKTNQTNQTNLYGYYYKVPPSFFIPNTSVLIKSSAVYIYNPMCSWKCGDSKPNGSRAYHKFSSPGPIPNTISYVVGDSFMYHHTWIWNGSDHCSMFWIYANYFGLGIGHAHSRKECYSDQKCFKSFHNVDFLDLYKYDQGFRERFNKKGAVWAPFCAFGRNKGLSSTLTALSELL